MRSVNGLLPIMYNVHFTSTLNQILLVNNAKSVMNSVHVSTLVQQAT